MNNQKKGNRFLKKLQNNLEWIILITLLAVVISSIYTFFLVTPIYEGTAEVLTTNPASEASEQTQSNVTYSVIATSDSVLEPVIDDLALETTPASLRENIQAEAIEESAVLSIQAQDENPYDAAEIANSVADRFVETAQEGTQILSQAVGVSSPVYPNHIKNILIGALIGFVMGLIVAIARGRDEDLVTDPEVTEEITGFRSLRNISTFTEDDLLILKMNSKTDPEKTIDTKDKGEVLSRMDRHRL